MLQSIQIIIAQARSMTWMMGRELAPIYAQLPLSLRHFQLQSLLAPPSLPVFEPYVVLSIHINQTKHSDVQVTITGIVIILIRINALTYNITLNTQTGGEGGSANISKPYTA